MISEKLDDGGVKSTESFSTEDANERPAVEISITGFDSIVEAISTTPPSTYEYVSMNRN